MSIHNLYAMTCGDFIKIGIAKDVEKRLNTLQVSVPFDVNFIRSVEYQNTDIDRRPFIVNAFLVERAIHGELTELGLHHRGEWFNDIEKTLLAFDRLTTIWNPDYVASRCQKFVQVAYETWNINLSDRKKLQKALGDNGPYIVERFRKFEPRKLSFLTRDNIERVHALLGDKHDAS